MTLAPGAHDGTATSARFLGFRGEALQARFVPSLALFEVIRIALGYDRPSTAVWASGGSACLVASDFLTGWPHGLKTLVGVMLGSSQPMFAS